jgi:hypothetical protein
MRLALLLLLVLGLVPVAATNAQRNRAFGRMREQMGDPNEFYTPPDFRGNAKYDGRFTFVRIKYRGYEHFQQEGPGWAHDYPRAESHLMKIMSSISAMRPLTATSVMLGGNILAADDPELMKYPVAYLSEPGGWHPTDAEVKGLHEYLSKGGFIIFDDFDAREDLMNLSYVMGKILPNSKILDLPQSHPIFDSFFKIDIGLLGRSGGRGSYRGTPEYYAIYQDNDPKKRIIAVVNAANDIGEYWEYSDQGFSPVPSNEAYKLGVNYLIYALTH